MEIFNFSNYWGIAPGIDVLPEFVKAQVADIERYVSKDYRFGDVLVERGHATKEQLDAWHSKKPDSARFGDFLSTLSDVSRGLKDAILPAIVASSAEPLLFITKSEFSFVGESEYLKNDLIRKECEIYNCVILNIGNRTFLAFAGLNEYRQWQQLGTSSKVKSSINKSLGNTPCCIAEPSLVAEILDKASNNGQQFNDEDVWKEAELESSGDDAQKWVTQILNYTIKEGASDFHITLKDDYPSVKVRVDGLLNEVPQQITLSNALYHAVKNWLVSKSHATKDGAPVYTPVDGESVSYMPKVGSGRSLRLSFMPMGSSGSAERKPVRIVCRVHPLRSQLKEDNVKRLTELSIYNPIVLEVLNELVELKGRMAIMAGPMNSGKTTTMYAVLKAMVEHYNGTKSIASVEDPIEQEVKGVDQIELSRKAKELGFGYAEYLKALKRQDTNVLYLGEIRDEETAVNAGQFASIGNTVLTTVHANSESQTMIRLRAMIPRAEDFDLLVSGIEYVMSQRLVRELCHHCKTKRAVTDTDKIWIASTLKRYGFEKESSELISSLTTVYHAGSIDCKVCKNSRSARLLPIIGILRLSDELRDLLLDRSKKRHEIRKELNAARIVTMTEQAIELVKKGLIALEDLNHG